MYWNAYIITSPFLAISLNSNIRCIEMTVVSKLDGISNGLNSNIRCIEIFYIDKDGLKYLVE